MQIALRTRATAIVKDRPRTDDLEAYGLRPPRYQLELAQSDSDPVILEIGDQVPEHKDEYYARQRRKKQIVYRVNLSALGPLLENDATHYLHPKVFPAPAEESVKAVGVKFAAGPAYYLLQDSEGSWRFRAGNVLADSDGVKEQIKKLLELTIDARLEPELDERREGLENPHLEVQVVTDAIKYLIQVGREVEPGIYTVRRLLPNEPGQPPSTFYYRVTLGDRVEELRKGHLSLLERSLVRAGFAEELKLLKSDGGLIWHARKEGKPTPVWAVKQGEAADPEAIERLVTNRLSDMTVHEWVARTEGADLARYGLDTPRRLEIAVSTFVNGQQELQTKTVLLGRRPPGEPDALYAMRAKGSAVGLVDASFLDELLRGLQTGTVVLENRRPPSGPSVCRSPPRPRNWYR